MDTSTQRVERYYVRLIVGSIGALVLLVLLGWGGHRVFVKWQERRLMRQAHAFLQRGEDQWAALAVQRAYHLNPANVDACRTMGDLTEKRGDASAIDWRRRVVELERSAQNTLQLAGTALRFNRVPMAAEALKKMPLQEKLDAGYHAVAARVSLAQNDRAAAESHLAEAARLAPADLERQLDFALFQIDSRDEAVRQKGRAAAERLKVEPTVRYRALRGLVTAASRADDGIAALAASRALSLLPEASFSDRLSYLGILRATGNDQFTAELTTLETAAAEKPDLAAQLISWMNAQSLSLLALDWVQRLPADLVARRPIPVLVTDSYVALSDWTGLQRWCRKGTWQDLEFLRHSVLARAARQLGDEIGFEAEWAAARKAVGNDAAQLSLLQQNVAKWGWETQSTDLLWTLAKEPSTQSAALDQLFRFYSEKGDTAELYRVLLNVAQVKPDDLVTQNNIAQLSLLLNIDAQRGHRIARELYDRDPRNPAFASTYAYSLFVNGKNKEAVRTMELLTPEQLHDPAIAAYYGILLAGSSDPARAQEFLTLGEKARLLPEEKALLVKAQRSLAPK